MTELTQRQTEVLALIRRYLREHRRSPSLQDLAVLMGFAGRTGAAHHVSALLKKGYLTRDYGWRGLRLTGPSWEERAIELLRRLQDQGAAEFLEEYDRERENDQTARHDHLRNGRARNPKAAPAEPDSGAAEDGAAVLRPQERYDAVRRRG